MRRLREAVIRDLGWLLNTANLTAVHDLAPYPEVAASVLNFGLPDLTGHSASGIDVAEMEGLLRTAILRFEPRILRNTLTVRLVRDETKMSHNTMAFDIVGEVWGQPVPTRIYLKTEIDLEMNEVRVSDSLSTGGG
jgi:type VI secretion system protein ImpF